MTGPDRLIRAITAQLDWLATRRRRIKRISGEEKASSRQHVVWLSGWKNVQCLEQAVPLLNHEENWKCMRERCVSSLAGLGSLRYCRRNGWRNSGKKTPPKLWEKENINSHKTENISWCRGSRARFCCITWAFTFNSFSWERERFAWFASLLRFVTLNQRQEGPGRFCDYFTNINYSPCINNDAVRL